MKFHCLYGPCGHTTEFSERAPEKWYKERYAAQGRYRHKCSKCGAAMAPAELVVNGITAEALHCFSECAIASECLGYDQYAPDCETPGLKQKCLLAIHKGIGALAARLDDIESRLPQKAELKLVPKAEATSGK